MKRFYMIFCVILAVLLLPGCGKPEKYTFKDPAIEAYVNGTPVYTLQKEQYIETEKIMLQAAVDSIDSQKAEGEDMATNSEEYDFSVTVMEDITYRNAKTMLAADAKKWNEEYYKTFLIRNELNGFLNRKPDTKAMYEKLVQDRETELKETGEFETDPGKKVDTNTLIQSLVKKYNLSAGQSFDTLLKPCFEAECETEMLASYFGGNLYKGTKVKWDGKNKDAYKAYLIDMNNQYLQYTDGLVKKADIEERGKNS